MKLNLKSIHTAMQRDKKVSLDTVQKAIGELLYLEDSDFMLIELILAVMLSRSQRNEKIWLIIIGRSSDGKTELLLLFDDGETNTKILKNITPKTLVNGNKDKAKYPDLAPRLRDKVVLLPEMASILKLHPNDKAQVWAQLRDLYDGTAGKQSGQGLDIRYDDLNVTLIGCSTPAIDSQVLIHQDLGTRELLWRTEEKDQVQLLNKVLENVKKQEKQAKVQKARELIQVFLAEREYKDTNIRKTSEIRIRQLAQLVTKLRATAEVDFATGELSNLMYPEQPARVFGQLLVLFNCLTALDPDYSEQRALRIIKHLITSSCSEIRLKILKYMLDHQGALKGQKKVANSLKVGNKTAYRELNILTHLNMLNLVEETPDKDKPQFTIKKWEVNLASQDIKTLADELNTAINDIPTEEVH